MQTRWGTFPLRFFFTDGYDTGSGEETSTRKIKLALKEMIGKEDAARPLSDEALAREALNVLGCGRGNHSHVVGNVLGLNPVASGLLRRPHELKDVLCDRGIDARYLRHCPPLSFRGPLYGVASVALPRAT